jgi:hypothetical protein
VEERKPAGSHRGLSTQSATILEHRHRREPGHQARLDDREDAVDQGLAGGKEFSLAGSLITAK